MRALSIKVDGENQGTLILCRCGNIITIKPEELILLNKTIIKCEICKNEILVTRDTE